MTVRLGVLVVASVLAVGCGGATQHAASTATGKQSTTVAAQTTTVTRSPGIPPLQAEATSAAAGDIPDNQVFLTYRSPRFSMKYPEGWVQNGSVGQVTFRDKNNIVRVVLGHRPSARVAVAGATVTAPSKTLTLPGGRTVKIVYRTLSAANPVTGKRLTLTVDRYTVAGPSGRRAVIDLGTPVGVDNVDAYRMMIESFRWR